MGFLGIIIIFAVIIWILREMETNRQLKKEELRKLENVKTNFRYEMLAYAKTNKKIARGVM